MIIAINFNKFIFFKNINEYWKFIRILMDILLHKISVGILPKRRRVIQKRTTSISLNLSLHAVSGDSSLASEAVGEGRL